VKIKKLLKSFVLSGTARWIESSGQTPCFRARDLK
jgi:hypothetical protein